MGETTSVTYTLCGLLNDIDAFQAICECLIEYHGQDENWSEFGTVESVASYLADSCYSEIVFEEVPDGTVKAFEAVLIRYKIPFRWVHGRAYGLCSYKGFWSPDETVSTPDEQYNIRSDDVAAALKSANPIANVRKLVEANSHADGQHLPDFDICPEMIEEARRRGLLKKVNKNGSITYVATVSETIHHVFPIDVRPGQDPDRIALSEFTEQCDKQNWNTFRVNTECLETK